MTTPAHWIAFGDIHDDISQLSQIPELATAKGVIVTGDITLGGGVKQAARMLQPIAERVPLLYAQIGNMDREEVTLWLEEQGWNLHCRARELYPGIVALGVGCSPFTPFGTPSEHPESRLAEWMEQAYKEAQNLIIQKEHDADAPLMEAYQRPHFILVAHTPPHGSTCDRLHNGIHVGSSAVREFIQEHQPDICLCGHIHESKAEEYIGRTHVINPGTLGNGGYVVLHLEKEAGRTHVRATLRSLY